MKIIFLVVECSIGLYEIIYLNFFLIRGIITSAENEIMVNCNNENPTNTAGVVVEVSLLVSSVVPLPPDVVLEDEVLVDDVVEDVEVFVDVGISVTSIVTECSIALPDSSSNRITRVCVPTSNPSILILTVSAEFQVPSVHRTPSINTSNPLG